MLISTEAIAINLFRAGNLAHAGKTFRAETPRPPPLRLFGNPQIRPPGLRNPPSTVPTGFPLAIPVRMITRPPRNGEYPLN